MMLWPTQREAWSITVASAITVDNIVSMVGRGKLTNILIVGCGLTFVAPPKDLRVGLWAAGLSLEWMDTGAACRTFNVLLSEERQVAAAMISVE